MGCAGRSSGPENWRAERPYSRRLGLDANLLQSSETDSPGGRAAFGRVSGGKAVPLPPISKFAVASFQRGVRGGGRKDFPAAASGDRRPRAALATIPLHGTPRSDPELGHGTSGRGIRAGDSGRSTEGRGALALFAGDSARASWGRSTADHAFAGPAHRASARIRGY